MDREQLISFRKNNIDICDTTRRNATQRTAEQESCIHSHWRCASLSFLPSHKWMDRAHFSCRVCEHDFSPIKPGTHRILATVTLCIPSSCLLRSTVCLFFFFFFFILCPLPSCAATFNQASCARAGLLLPLHVRWPRLCSSPVCVRLLLCCFCAFRQNVLYLLP